MTPSSEMNSVTIIRPKTSSSVRPNAGTTDGRCHEPSAAPSPPAARPGPALLLAGRRQRTHHPSRQTGGDRHAPQYLLTTRLPPHRRCDRSCRSRGSVAMRYAAKTLTSPWRVSGTRALSSAPPRGGFRNGACAAADRRALRHPPLDARPPRVGSAQKPRSGPRWAWPRILIMFFSLVCIVTGRLLALVVLPWRGETSKDVELVSAATRGRRPCRQTHPGCDSSRLTGGCWLP